MPRPTQPVAAAAERPKIFEIFISAKANVSLASSPSQLLDEVARLLLASLDGDAKPVFDWAWLGTLPQGGHDGVLKDMITWAGETPKDRPPPPPRGRKPLPLSKVLAAQLMQLVERAMEVQHRIRDAPDCSFSGILSGIMVGRTKTAMGIKRQLSECLGRQLAADKCSGLSPAGCPHKLGAHHMCFMQCFPDLANNVGSTARLCLRCAAASLPASKKKQTKYLSRFLNAVGGDGVGGEGGGGDGVEEDGGRDGGGGAGGGGEGSGGGGGERATPPRRTSRRKRGSSSASVAQASSANEDEDEEVDDRPLVEDEDPPRTQEEEEALAAQLCNVMDDEIDGSELPEEAEGEGEAEASGAHPEEADPEWKIAMKDLKALSEEKPWFLTHDREADMFFERLCNALDTIGTQIVNMPVLLDVRQERDANYSLFEFYDRKWRDGPGWNGLEQTRLPRDLLKCFYTLLHAFQKRIENGERVQVGYAHAQRVTAELKDLYAQCLHAENSVLVYERVQSVVGSRVDSLLYWCERQPAINYKVPRQKPQRAMERAASFRFEFEPRPPPKRKKSRNKTPRGGCAWHLPSTMDVEDMR